MVQAQQLRLLAQVEHRIANVCAEIRRHLRERSEQRWKDVRVRAQHRISGVVSIQLRLTGHRVDGCLHAVPQIPNATHLTYFYAARYRKHVAGGVAVDDPDDATLMDHRIWIDVPRDEWGKRANSLRDGPPDDDVAASDQPAGEQQILVRQPPCVCQHAREAAQRYGGTRHGDARAGTNDGELGHRLAEVNARFGDVDSGRRLRRAFDGVDVANPCGRLTLHHNRRRTYDDAQPANVCGIEMDVLPRAVALRQTARQELAYTDRHLLVAVAILVDVVEVIVPESRRSEERRVG